MRNSEDRSSRGLAPVFLSALSMGCAPTVDVAGVYFPGWLVSATTGVVAAYLALLWLGRRPGARGLAESGLLFVALVVTIALAVWWLAFRGF